jgi:hypothetical protein
LFKINKSDLAYYPVSNASSFHRPTWIHELRNIIKATS